MEFSVSTGRVSEETLTDREHFGVGLSSGYCLRPRDWKVPHGDSGQNSLEYWDYTVELEMLKGPADLQLAAELGKTLLERNKDLEGTIRDQRAIIEDKTQEIEFSLIHKKESAHTEGIWSCAWGLYKPENKENEPPTQNGETQENGETDQNKEEENLPEKETHYVVSGGLDDNVKVWHWEGEGVEGELSLLHSLEGHSLGVISVDINKAGTLVASSSLDSTIRLWKLHEGKQMQSIDCGPVEAWSVVFSPDGKHIASGNHAGKINVYSVSDGRLVNALDTRGRFTYSIAYSEDGKYIASGAIDGFINVFDIESGKLVHTLEGHAMTIRSLAFSPDSQLLLTSADDGHMKLYDVKSSNLVCTLSGHGSWVLSVDFAPDQVHFVSSSSDHMVKVWEFAQRSCVHTFKDHQDQVWCAKYSKDSTKIVSVSDDKAVIVYNSPV